MIDTSRRRLVAGIAAAAALAGCSLPLRRYAGPRLPAARISADLVSRVLVGLRPYRAAGFVVAAEALGDKRIVHNYGHGGGGITLSWGTAELAVDIGFDGVAAPCAVIGCGAVGLATARVLQERGARVTIYAKALPPETTSDIAGGHWSPYSVFSVHQASAAFLEQFHRAVRISYRRFQALADARHGISWRSNYVINHDYVAPGEFLRSLDEVMPGFASLRPGEHPFGDTHVQTWLSMMVEPPIYLPALIDEFLAAGGRIQVREFASREAIAALPERVVFNCTGLGAKALFDDGGMEPARGQLVLLQPQPDIDYNTFSAPGCYMFSRRDALVLGGSFERGDWSLAPSEADTARIIAGNARAMALLTS